MPDLKPFASLPDAANVWIYAFPQELSAEAEAIVVAHLQAFLPEWNAHGTPVRGAFTLVERRFVIIAGWCPEPISGCSIDSKVRVFKTLRDEHAIDGLDRTWVFHRDDAGRIQANRRADFRRLVAQGAIGETTPVFDTTVPTLEVLRSDGFEIAFAASWHARLAPVA